MTAAEHVRSYFAALNRHDPDAVVGHVAEDFVNEHASLLASGCVGRAGYRERLPHFFDRFQDIHYEVDDVIVDGARAAAPYRMTARYQGVHSLDKRGAMFFDLRDGLITRRTDYTDSLTFLEQTGQWTRPPA